MRGKVLEALGGGKALVATPAQRKVSRRCLTSTSSSQRPKTNSSTRSPCSCVTPIDVERLAASARAWAVENLSVQRSVEGFERLYDSLSPPGAAVSGAPRTTA